MKIDLYGDGIGSVEYVQHMGEDITVVNSARVSFGRHKEELDGRDKKLIKYLIRHRHTSTLEHNTITFRFAVPLFVRSQHHRHRTWSYNEISRRYTDVDISFYEPKMFRTQHELEWDSSTAYHKINNHHRQSLELFNSLIGVGVCREQARGVLPQNMYTHYYGTVNLNNLLKFIDLRIHEGAQWEIQEVAKACLEISTKIWPYTVGAYRELRE